MTAFSGWKTYLAAAGLLGLAVHQFSQGQYEIAIQTFMQGLGLLGLRWAIQTK